jgi:hypothetical protein
MTEKKVCLSCGHGTQGDPWGNPTRCSYCGAGEASFTGTEHVHKFGLRCNGSAQCVGHRYLDCPVTDYDSQWGAGIFNDWPRGTSKPYGA